MPIYEFNCPKCKIVFEDLVFGQNTPPCPKCGCEKTEKLLSRPTLHMQGEPNRAGRQVSFPSSGGGCAGCSGGSCSTCGS